MKPACTNLEKKRRWRPRKQEVGSHFPQAGGADPLLEGSPGRQRGLGICRKHSERLGLVEHISNPTTQEAGPEDTQSHIEAKANLAYDNPTLRKQNPYSFPKPNPPEFPPANTHTSASLSTQCPENAFLGGGCAPSQSATLWTGAPILDRCSPP